DQIGEILEHGRTAWMVEPGDVGSLVAGLERLVEDEPLRKRLGEAARREAIEKYTWREHTRKIIERLRKRCGEG
ncbi:MAG: glycosyltransferase, partial [Candidatus Deferrimicrobiaceae bacterium]